MAQNDQDKDFLEFLIKSIVDNPDEVHVERTIDEMGVLLTLKVHREDMGQVVGRKGATAKAIRSLLRIVGLKNNARVNLKILEPEGGLRAGMDADMHSSMTPSPVDQAVEDLTQGL